MTWQAARHEEDGVDADVVSGAHEARRQPFGSDGDAAQAIVIKRHGGAFIGRARLDLNEGENAAAAGDQVDFAAGHPRAFSENAPAMQSQPPGGQPLGLATALFGKLAAVQRLSSRARA